RDVLVRVVADFFFFSSRRRHTRFSRDWSSDVCSSDLAGQADDLLPLVHRGALGEQAAQAVGRTGVDLSDHGMDGGVERGHWKNLSLIRWRAFLPAAAV